MTLAEPLFEFVDFAIQSLGKMTAELREVFADEWDFLQPAIDVDAQQLGKVFFAQIQALVSRSAGSGSMPIAVSIRVSLAFAAFKDPLQHAAVLSISGPEKFSLSRRCETS